MRNITLHADGELIERARRRAESGNTTLNNAFRDWLAIYAAPPHCRQTTSKRIVAGISHFRAGRRFTREERNQRYIPPSDRDVKIVSRRRRQVFTAP